MSDVVSLKDERPIAGLFIVSFRLSNEWEESVPGTAHIEHLS